jgi:hypothetical protein
MRKFAVAAISAIFALLTLGIAHQAIATPALLPAPAPNYSPVQQVGCGGPGRYCPAGYHWACGPYRCGCVACVAPYAYRPYVYRPYVYRPFAYRPFVYGPHVRVRVW